MSLTNKNIDQYVDGFLFRYFPDAQMVILCGSAAYGTLSPGSDIDLAIFQDGIKESIHDRFRYRKVFFDVSLFDPTGVDAFLFNKSRHLYGGKFLSYFADGMVIKDNLGLAADIIRFANRYYHLGAVSCKQEDLSFHAYDPCTDGQLEKGDGFN